MSYQVLARKWRPGRFSELVGQEHVVSAISNALNNNRLHHAYLFTGTRGVGKTTIARIFSKSLNCETGMSANPCGKCATCVEIEQGNYVDLLEIDAASRTKVEDTRELLDNVQYKPTRGDYKVYLIDEVHMLSKHSFNALLKTLEEPPPHVKFLLATTDPQKLPITILSRCLQFNLKALSREQISGQLHHILGQEGVAFEEPAVSQLARAAQGSMRDALSLTDQAIAQGNGQVSTQVVTDMLGLMDKGKVLKLLHATLSKDHQAVLDHIDDLGQQAVDFQQVLNEVMSLLHQIALTQFVPEACKLETVSARAIYQLAKQTPAEQVQLLYQIALQGKKDIHYAPDGKTGLEMTMLRMLAFNPAPVSISSDEFNKLDAEQVSVPSIPAPAPAPAKAETSRLQDDIHAHAGQSQPEPQQPAQSALSQEASPAVQPEVDVQAAPHGDSSDTLDSQVEQPEAAACHPQFEAPQPLMSPEPPPMDIPPYEEDAPEYHDDRTMAMFAEQEDVMAQAASLHPAQHGEQQDTTAQVLQEDNTVADPLSKTQSLLAMKNRLNSTDSGQEGGEETEKKPATDALNEGQKDVADGFDGIVQGAPDVGTLTENPVHSEQAPDSPANGPEDPLVPLAEEKANGVEGFAERIQSPVVPVADLTKTASVSAEALSPPWQTQQDTTVPEFVGKGEVLQLEPAAEFNPLEHLDEQVNVEVDFEVPAFLSEGQKVTAARQLDTWSHLIEQMQVEALTKQLALHSSYQQQEGQVSLTLLDGKQHLDTPLARQQLEQALSDVLQQPVTLTINVGQPVNTPYAVQQAINATRLEHARSVVEKDETITIIRDTFAASVVEDSIKPR